MPLGKGSNTVTVYESSSLQPYTHMYVEVAIGCNTCYGKCVHAPGGDWKEITLLLMHQIGFSGAYRKIGCACHLQQCLNQGEMGIWNLCTGCTECKGGTNMHVHTCMRKCERSNHRKSICFHLQGSFHLFFESSRVLKFFSITKANFHRTPLPSFYVDNEASPSHKDTEPSRAGA